MKEKQTLSLSKSNNLYDKVGVIVRASPPHLGHKHLILEAKKRAKKVVILVGSARSAPTIKNPFSLQTRIDLIRSMFTPSEWAGIDIVGLPDDLYNMERWIGRLQERMEADYTDNVAIASSTKDGDDMKRLSWCPFWDVVAVPTTFEMSATKIRKILFEPVVEDWKVTKQLNPNLDYFVNSKNPAKEFHVAPSVHDYLANEYFGSEAWNRLRTEWEGMVKFNLPEQEAMAKGILKYPIIHQTVDPIVICAGHFLMVRRAGAIGNGLLAFPGGFVEKDKKETLLEAALRELDEETGIDVPPKILESNVQFTQNFNHPERSNIGQLITQAFVIHLPPQLKTAKGDGITKGGHDRLFHGMPKIRKKDKEGEVKEAMWVPIYKFKSLAEQMHDDHYDMGVFARDRINSLYR